METNAMSEDNKIRRVSYDLGDARTNEKHSMYLWKYLYIGDCTGTVTIKLGSTSHDALNPEEFEKLEDIAEYTNLYITNTAQAGKVLVIYYEGDAKW